MRKIIAVTLVVFLLAFGVGTMLVSTDVQAKQIPCTYKCINQDTYLCCYYPPPVGEVCTWQSTGCW